MNTNFYCSPVLAPVNFTEVDFLNQAYTAQNNGAFALVRASECTPETLQLRSGFGFVLSNEGYLI
jgi:hypothetical protein